MAEPPEPDQRVLRVFISSTFRDMQAERDELVKRVFPQVRRVCEARGVTWGEVDLRWGVTDEQKADGDVLPICLAEIERTRPYFIGLLGQRYGWVPDDLPTDLPPDWTWLTDAAGRSVTELEILHGVLNDGDSAGHAYFYLRDPAWVDALPEQDRALYVEDSEPGARKLAHLRDRVRASGHPVRDYADPEELGRIVLADLLALVDRLYPEADRVDAEDRETAAHAAFAARRATAYVDRPELSARLDAAAESGGVLVVTGEAGAGASALVADWARDRRVAHPDDVVVEHFVAATPQAAGWAAMVTRVAAQLAGALGRADLALDPPPAEPGALRAAFAGRLAGAATSSRRIVVVVDGVDGLADEDGAPDLLWLPPRPPEGVAVVVTGRGPRPLGTAANRGWPVLEIPPLRQDERRAVATAYLARFSKSLDEAPLDRLATAERTGNPFYLRTVLDEMRQHGDHFTLPGLMDRLLAAPTADDLLEQVLARYERDFERDRPGLVREAFTSLWAARRGLSEAELRDLLGQLPQAVWAPLSLAAEELLASSSGLLSPGSEALRRAIEDRYLPREADRAAAHLRLADHFAGARPGGPPTDRVIDELPWQQVWAGEVDALVRTLSDPGFAEAAYVRSLPDLRRLWARAQALGRSMADAYEPVVADPAAYDGAGSGQLVWGVARLLTDGGHPAPALALNRYLVDAARRDPAGSGEAPGGDARLRAALVNLGAALWAQGIHTEADPVLEEAVRRCRAAGDDRMLATALGDLVLVRRDAGDRASALALSDEEGTLCRRLGDPHALQAHLGNRAQLLRLVGDYDGALAALAEQEQVCRGAADRAGVARSLAGRAAVASDRGDIAAALALTVEQGLVCDEDGDLRGQAESRLNEAVLRAQLGQGPGAQHAAAAAEGIARRLGDAGLLARVLTARANAAATAGDWAGAEAAAREAELTARSSGALPQAAVALGLIGTARREQGDLAGCRSAHEEELRIASLTADPQAVATAHANLGTCDLAENRWTGALERYALAEPTFRRLSVHSSLLPLLANRAQLHEMQQQTAAAVADYADAADSAALLGLADATRQWGERGLALAYHIGDSARAESLWQSLESAYRASEDDAALQRALGERALLLIARAQADAAVGAPDTGLLKQAARLLDEQEAICRRTGDQSGLAACVGNRAIVLRYRGDLDGSLACLDEQVAIAGASGNAQGWLIGTANRGEVLGLLGRTDEALAALRLARDTAAGYGSQLQAMVQQLEQMIAALGSR